MLVGMCQPLFAIWLSLTSLTEADEKDDSGATTMNIGSDKCILLCVHPQVFLHWVLLRNSFYVAVIAGASLLPAGIHVRPACEPRFPDSHKWSILTTFPWRKHVTLYCEGRKDLLTYEFLRENKNQYSLCIALGFPVMETTKITTLKCDFVLKDFIICQKENSNSEYFWAKTMDKWKQVLRKVPTESLMRSFYL